MDNVIIRILAVEAYKLRRGRALFLVPSAVVAANAVLFFGMSLAVEGDFFGVPSGFYISSASIGWAMNLVAVVAAIITAFQISNEFAMGTVKNLWTQPLSRQSWFGAKVLFACSVVSFLILASIFTLLILSSIKYRFNDLVENRLLIHSAADMWFRLINTSLLTLWSCIALVSSVAAISSFCNRPGTSISFTFGLGFSMMILSVFPPIRPFLLYTYIQLPFEQMTAMSKGLPLPLPWGELIWKSLLVPGIYMAVSLFTGQFIIRRKEIGS